MQYEILSLILQAQNGDENCLPTWAISSNTFFIAYTTQKMRFFH